MLFTVLLKVLVGKSVIDQKNLRSIKHVSTGIEHNIFQLEVIKSSLCSMDVSENVDQLIYDMNGHFNLLVNVDLRYILLQVHLVKGHDVVGQIH